MTSLREYMAQMDNDQRPTVDVSNRTLGKHPQAIPAPTWPCSATRKLSRKDSVSARSSWLRLTGGNGYACLCQNGAPDYLATRGPRETIRPGATVFKRFAVSASERWKNGVSSDVSWFRDSVHFRAPH